MQLPFKLHKETMFSFNLQETSKLPLTMYTDLCLSASLYSSFISGRGLLGALRTFFSSTLISKSPVLDFWRAATMTLHSEVKDLSLRRK